MSAIAAKVRQHKESNPELYCRVPSCLWRIKSFRGDEPCRKHPLPSALAQHDENEAQSRRLVGELQQSIAIAEASKRITENLTPGHARPHSEHRCANPACGHARRHHDTTGCDASGCYSCRAFAEAPL